jgi:hypothetical protein
VESPGVVVFSEQDETNNMENSANATKLVINKSYK